MIFSHFFEHRAHRPWLGCHARTNANDCVRRLPIFVTKFTPHAPSHTVGLCAAATPRCAPA
jgi:hypothetical protein